MKGGHCACKQLPELVSWSLTSLFSTNMAISETKTVAGRESVDLMAPFVYIFIS